MKTVNGIYTSAQIFTETIEDYALAQIRMLCDHPASAGSRICIMPDVHPGTPGPVGLTQTIRDCVLPAMVGSDIGCGISLIKIKQKKLEFQQLDTLIREHIPVGPAIRRKAHPLSGEFDCTRLYCHRHINSEKARLSLGGGNHFIEADRDEEGNLYLVVHSGSRHLGKEVTDHYMRAGSLRLKETHPDTPYLLTWLTGELMEQYLHDMSLITEFAALNREIILAELTKRMKLKVTGRISCIHNYIGLLPSDPESDPEQPGKAPVPVIRKGAISAKAGEPLIIPVNMRDGVILATGKGNPDWNYSAPHGSGRIMARNEVKNHYSVSRFKAEMARIHCSCIGADTLDESPFAYRADDEIIRAIEPTATVTNLIKPVYNYKAGSRK